MVNNESDDDDTPLTLRSPITILFNSLIPDTTNWFSWFITPFSITNCFRFPKGIDSFTIIQSFVEQVEIPNEERIRLLTLPILNDSSPLILFNPILITLTLFNSFNSIDFNCIRQFDSIINRFKEVELNDIAFKLFRELDPIINWLSEWNELILNDSISFNEEEPIVMEVIWERE